MRPADCWYVCRQKLILPFIMEGLGDQSCSPLQCCVGEIASVEVGLGGRCFESRY